VDFKRIKKINARRYNFNDQRSLDNINRSRAWDNLIRHKFQNIITPDSVVLDLGCGPGDFINKIVAKKKIAIDIDKSTAVKLDPDIIFFNTSCSNLYEIKDKTVDYVFSSNMFEHLDSIETLLKTLEEVKRILKSNAESRLIVMMPNARKIGMKFYDFIDHTLPLTDFSLNEALEITGFQVLQIFPGFFPYTATAASFKIPNFLISLYLKIPLKNKPGAGQMLCIATLSKVVNGKSS
jgi:ubiquinone/menaquinone biosynthesis C-methylase UbiE